MYTLLVIAIVFTSVISGVLSMAGGIILMGIFGFFLSVPVAMVLHGVAQAASNGARIWLHRRHIRWQVLPPYFLGAMVILALFTLVAFVPSKGLLFLLIGIFPFAALALPARIDLDMERKPVSFVCGLLVTAGQMLAGASGPLLDIFYVQSRMNRHEILGTKAVTQTFGHVIKLSYYGLFLATVTLPLWIYPAAVVAALAGNWAGKQLVDRISDEHFKTAGRVVILIVGAICIGKGIHELFFL